MCTVRDIVYGMIHRMSVLGGSVFLFSLHDNLTTPHFSYQSFLLLIFYCINHFHMTGDVYPTNMEALRPRLFFQTTLIRITLIWIIWYMKYNYSSIKKLMYFGILVQRGCWIYWFYFLFLFFFSSVLMSVKHMCMRYSNLDGKEIRAFRNLKTVR